MSETMTANQRQALECFRAARKRGVALCVYAREQGLSERVIYDAVAALRRKGMLPAAGSGAATVARDFVAVRIAPPALSPEPPDLMVCQIRVGSTLITCRQWPPAAWLSTLGQTGFDATTPEH